jgi:hypothetical protein
MPVNTTRKNKDLLFFIENFPDPPFPLRHFDWIESLDDEEVETFDQPNLYLKKNSQTKLLFSNQNFFIEHGLAIMVFEPKDKKEAYYRITTTNLELFQYHLRLLKTILQHEACMSSPSLLAQFDKILEDAIQEEIVPVVDRLERSLEADSALLNSQKVEHKQISERIHKNFPSDVESLERISALEKSYSELEDSIRRTKERLSAHRTTLSAQGSIELAKQKLGIDKLVYRDSPLLRPRNTWNPIRSSEAAQPSLLNDNIARIII